MPGALDEDLVHRLPLLLGLLYRRAHEAQNPLEQHLTAFYLWQARLKLLASVAVVNYATADFLDEQIAERLKSLARSALGHWWEFAWRLVPILADRDLAGFPRVRELLLGRRRDDLPRAARPDALLREVLEGRAGARTTVRLAELFERLVQLRNKALGRGALGQRPRSFYVPTGPASLAGVSEILGRMNTLAGHRLLFVIEVRRQPSGEWLKAGQRLGGPAGSARTDGGWPVRRGIIASSFETRARARFDRPTRGVRRENPDSRGLDKTAVR